MVTWSLIARPDTLNSEQTYLIKWIFLPRIHTKKERVFFFAFLFVVSAKIIKADEKCELDRLADSVRTWCNRVDLCAGDFLAAGHSGAGTGANKQSVRFCWNGCFGGTDPTPTPKEELPVFGLGVPKGSAHDSEPKEDEILVDIHNACCTFRLQHWKHQLYGRKMTGCCRQSVCRKQKLTQIFCTTDPRFRHVAASCSKKL